MAKTVKRVIGLLAFITIATIIVLIIISNKKTFYNEEGVTGNSQGNIYNGGLFSENDGLIYFSNPRDDGSLYVMTSNCNNIRKVHDDKAVYINVDDHYIYYVRANNTKENSHGNILNFYNTGIYRLNRNGKNLRAVSTKPSSYLTLCGNFLYYQNYDIDKGLHLYRQNIDTTMDRLLIEDAVIPMGVNDNILYYTGSSKNHNINSLHLSSFTNNIAYEGSFASPIVHGDHIYYIDISDKYSIGRMDLDGSNKVTIVEDRCFTYNITNSGRYLYYQVDNQTNNRIARIDLNTMEEEIILHGDYKQIHVTDNFVFFKDFHETNTFVVPADGKIELGSFEPPVEELE